MLSRNPPLVSQVISEIVAEICHGDLKIREALPSEAEFSRRLGVSRATIREALGKLEDGGAIVRRHGVGTFISPMAVSHRDALPGWFSEVSNFIDVIQHMGHEPDCQLLEMVIEVASAAAEPLGISPQSQAVRYNRLFLASSQPVICSVNYIPLELVDASRRATICSEHKYYQSTYDLVREYCNRTTDYHKAEVCAVVADEDLANLLRCAVGDPLLYTEDTGYASDIIPLWHGRYWYRADRVRFAQMHNPKMIVS